jgi:hypothetical protein
MVLNNINGNIVKMVAISDINYLVTFNLRLTLSYQLKKI